MPLLITLFLLLFSSTMLAKTLPATSFQVTQDFINKMVKVHDFNQAELHAMFSKIDLIITDETNKTNKPSKPSKPSKAIKQPKPLSWDTYRALFMTNKRIHNGVQFWKDNLSSLQRAEKQYNVPPEIIVAILGIESNYGRHKGTHPVLETLARLSFNPHRRQPFYQKELEEFLLMSRENALSPLTIKGSYAGALGYAQFIASSYRHYAVDFDSDHKIDLFNSAADAIGSIANYFDQHQWHDSGAYARPVNLPAHQKKHAKSGINKPKTRALYWRNKGFKIDDDIHNKTKLAFIKLPQDNHFEIWLTFWNFYVLTRYNHNNKYAMTIVQLSKKIKQQFIQHYPKLL